MSPESAIATIEFALGPHREAQDLWRNANALLVRDGMGMGVRPPNVTVPADVAVQRELNKNIDATFEHVETSLKALDDVVRSLKNEVKAPARTILVLSIVLFTVAMIAFLWGVVRGSKIALFGGSGAFAFSVTFAFAQLKKLNRDAIALATLASRARARLSICRAHHSPVEILNCLKYAVGTIDEYFRELWEIGKDAKTAAARKPRPSADGIATTGKSAHD